MHGLHDVDQNDTIIGVPSSRRVLVLKASPLAFSTVTDGTCAAHTAEMKSAMLKRNVLIFYKFCLIINFLREKISGKITQKNPLFQFFLSEQARHVPCGFTLKHPIQRNGLHGLLYIMYTKDVCPVLESMKMQHLRSRKRFFRSYP